MKFYKKIVACLLAVLVLCQFALPFASATGIEDAEEAIASQDEFTTASTQGFSDVPSGKFYTTAVNFMQEIGIVSGKGNNKFCPDDSLTRAELVQILWAMNNKPTNSSWKNHFSDVRSSDWFYKAVLWAQNNNITAGTSANKFSPNGRVTVEQAYVFLARFAHDHRKNDAGWLSAYNNGKVNGSKINLHNYYVYSDRTILSEEGYPTTSTISSWAVNSIIALTVYENYYYNNKTPNGRIVLGTPRPNQSPSGDPSLARQHWGAQGPCSRANFIYVLYRVFKDEMMNQSSHNYNYYRVNGSIDITCTALKQSGSNYKYKLTYKPNFTFKTRDNKDWSFIGNKLTATSQHNAHVLYTVYQNGAPKQYVLCGIPSTTNLSALTSPVKYVVPNLNTFYYTSTTYNYKSGIPANIRAYWTVALGTNAWPNIISASVSYNKLWYGDRSS